MRSLRSLLPLVMVSLLANSTSALPTSTAYDVLLDEGVVGVMTLRNRVLEDGRGHCMYTGRWSSLGPLRRTTICRLDEYTAGDYLDCEENRTRGFPTVVTQNSLGCSGFDDFGQFTRLQFLIAGEGHDGSLTGVAMTASIGDVQNFEMLPRSPVRLPQ